MSKAMLLSMLLGLTSATAPSCLLASDVEGDGSTQFTTSQLQAPANTPEETANANLPSEMASSTQTVIQPTNTAGLSIESLLHAAAADITGTIQTGEDSSISGNFMPPVNIEKTP